jgi:hypothetical protein
MPNEVGKNKVQRFDLETLPVAVAIFCFNRPAALSQLLDALKLHKPRRVLIVADGPRSGSESDFQKCKEVEALYRNIPWECEVSFNIAPKNMGLKDRFSSGLKWIFEMVESAIILEDDCIPHASFFHFSEEMLKRYELDESVGMVQGWSLFSSLPIPQDFYFSDRPKVWGWATWRRVVKDFDVEIPFWAKIDQVKLLRKLGFPWYQIPGMRKKIDAASHINTWDYQWVAYMWSRRYSSIAPKRRLIRNIGFGQDATHTTLDFGGYSGNPKPLEGPYSPSPAPRRIGRLVDKSENVVSLFRWVKAAVASPGTASRLILSRVLKFKGGDFGK